MKFLKININYDQMINDFYKKTPNIEHFDYDKLLNKYLDEFYWPSNSLEKSLSKLYNWECNTLIFTISEDIDNSIFFNKWCEKNKIKPRYKNRLDNLLLQIIHYKPNILYFHEIWFYPKDFFEKIRFLLKDIIIMGWDCAPGTFAHMNKLKFIDIVYTCWKEKEISFKKNGINSLCVGHFFDIEVLNKLKSNEKKYDVVFAGTINRETTKERSKFLKELISKNINLKLFAQTNDPFLKKYCLPPVYGIDFLQVFKNSKIVLNQHVIQDIRYSANIRMYETTGIGSLLLTDYKEDLKEKFEENKEIIVYKSTDEIIEKIDYFLKNENEREKIAQEGQKKTLKNYSYDSFANKIYEFINFVHPTTQDILIKQLDQIILTDDFSNKNLKFNISLNQLLNQINEINEKKSSIAIYGYSRIYKLLESHFKNVVVICDQSFEKNSKNNVFCNPTELLLYNFEYIIITALGKEKEIISFLTDTLQISKNKILTLKT